MDDDFSFQSIWGAPADPSPIPSPKPPTLAPPLDDFPPAPSSSQGETDVDDDFDDFGTAPSGAPSEMPDDDFGDFGDFGEAEASGTPADFGDDGFEQQVPIAVPPIPDSDWEPLKLDPLPSRIDLRSQLDDVLGPILDDDISEYTTGEDVRQVEGVSQILVTTERYVCAKTLWNTHVEKISNVVVIYTTYYFTHHLPPNRQTGRDLEFDNNI